ncbi:MAG: cytochrome b/b6 domain-containing protein [Dehalococcoidales bacterium]|nr:cytochrome b/b6 domain-containing protein [Dehalococcoidales bacterium]
MNRNKWIVIIILVAVFTIGIIFSAYLNTLLLSKIPWLLAVSAITGILLGILKVRFKSKTAVENGKISRHGIGAFIQHWLTALGIFLLIISGFIIGFLFFPHFVDTPKSVLFPLNMHFIGLNITLLGGFYFLTDYTLSGRLSMLMPNIKDISHGTIGKYLLKKKWNKEGKYLSSQKSAFLAYAILGGVQIITGSIKIMGHFFNIPSSTLAITTSIHDIFSLLFIIMLAIHILFVILSREHRILLKSWFTGKVSESYAKEKHKDWYDELSKQ